MLLPWHDIKQLGTSQAITRTFASNGRTIVSPFHLLRPLSSELLKHSIQTCLRLAGSPSQCATLLFSKLSNENTAVLRKAIPLMSGKLLAIDQIPDWAEPKQTLVISTTYDAIPNAQESTVPFAHETIESQPSL